MTSAFERATGSRHDVAIVLGSGLGRIAHDLVGGDPLPYSGIEGIAPSTVEGHEGALYRGTLGTARVLVLAGRTHLYEGHDARAVVAPVEAAVAAGCRVVILTNAAGGIDPALEVGAPCLISDHLNLTGTNPFIGPHDGRGPRFLDATEVYDAGLRSLARRVDPDLSEGVYAGLTGPVYETPAEIRMLRALGAQLVGMSTVLEALTARYLGAQVLGISLVTNRAAGLSDRPLTHAEVAAASERAAGRLTALLRGVVEGLDTGRS